jgi:hypothetical protein
VEALGGSTLHSIARQGKGRSGKADERNTAVEFLPDHTDSVHDKPYVLFRLDHTQGFYRSLILNRR